jgi:excisionase family DNA binding protein
MAEPFNLSPREAAAIVGCHEDTLKRWAADGQVKAFRTPGGWWKFRRSDLDALVNRPPSCPTCTVPTWHGKGGCPNAAEPVAS